MPSLDKAKAKHNEIVRQLERDRAARDKAITILLRREAKYQRSVSAVARSSKRLDKLRAVEPVNAGPFPKALPDDDVAIEPMSATGESTLVELEGGLTASGAHPLDPPDFLKRDPQEDKDARAKRELEEQARAKDREAAIAIRQEIAEKSRARAAARAARRNAIARGDTKRMPLSGRAALDYITRT